MAAPAEISAAEWRIDVANGLNTGAHVSLAAGSHRLGYDPANDIVLADPAIAAEQAVFDIGPTGASLIALAPGAMVQRRRLPVGRRQVLRPGSEIRLGETVLRIIGPPASLQPISLWKAVAAALLLGAPGAGIAYWFSAPSTPRSGPAIEAASQSEPAVAPARAASALESHLAAAKLGGAIHIATADAAIVASGAVLPADRAAWLDAQRWFDAKFAGHITLIDRVGLARAGELPELNLAAVSMTPVPNVVTRDGAHYTTGAMLQGGWSIDSIRPDGVTLRLGARTIHMTL